MNGVELRPQSLGQLLDRAFALYRKNFWLFAGTLAIPASLYIPAQFYLLRKRGVPFPWSKTPPHPAVTMFVFGTLFFFWILYAIAYGAATYAVADAYLGGASTVRKAYARIRVRFWRVMSLILNAGLRAFGWIFLFLTAGIVPAAVLIAELSPGSAVPRTVLIFLAMGCIGAGFGCGLWFSIRYAVSMPAMLLEDINASAAIRRSLDLTRGSRGRIFLGVLLSVVLSYTAAIVFQGPFYVAVALLGIKGQLPTWVALALSVSGTLGATTTSPLLMIVLVLSYYDLRIRKEGFDLQFMMTSLDVAKPVESSSQV